MSCASHYIQTCDFILQSTHVKEYILFLISQHLHKYYLTKLNFSNDDDRFVEVESVKIVINHSSLYSISYEVTFGHGYKLPKFIHTSG